MKQQIPAGYKQTEVGVIPDELNAPSRTGFHSLNEILEFLAKLPSAQEIIALHPSQELQQQIDSLLEKQRTVDLNAEEELQWQQYEYLEHLVRIAKANALLKPKLKK